MEIEITHALTSFRRIRHDVAIDLYREMTDIFQGNIGVGIIVSDDFLDLSDSVPQLKSDWPVSVFSHPGRAPGRPTMLLPTSAWLLVIGTTTCGNQGRSFFQFLHESISASLSGEEPTRLLPE